MLVYRKITGGEMSVGFIEPNSSYDLQGPTKVGFDADFRSALGLHGSEREFATFKEAAQWLADVFPAAIVPGCQYDAANGCIKTFSQLCEG
jgi:hypothetical protein